MLAPGHRAPGFTLVDQPGDEVALESLPGRGTPVYFDPEAEDTPEKLLIGVAA